MEICTDRDITVQEACDRDVAQGRGDVGPQHPTHAPTEERDMGQRDATGRHRSEPVEATGRPDHEADGSGTEIGDTSTGASREARIAPGQPQAHPEETVDCLEEKVLGEVTSQARDEDEDIAGCRVRSGHQ
ncbi:MAG: hypothetical protein GEU74_13365 [Nitriliruptorales bacterium]|nr:hypothetical protein [Nitriliruptorales bacterium]